MNAEDIVRRLALIPHPEGGYYRETYRAAETVRRGDGARRAAGTAIYYLLCNGAYSAWHRIQSDEIWHFYAGGELRVHELQAQGGLVTHRLGPTSGAFQTVVRAGNWFGAELADPDGYALVGCTVAPGFEFSEFELADTAALLRAYAAHEALVRRLGPGR
ncbi:cupin domain-containing protein [Bordetella hinzii]|uniref:cupin domain-containing protein n=1 Tax=Bordetella hinzii TaxID=103855 RepID=UPI0039FD30B6